MTHPIPTPVWLLLPLVTACGIPGPTHTLWPRPTDARVTLPEGATIQLASASVGEGRGRPPSSRVDGLWRVAMLQSHRFDFAAGLESCPTRYTVTLHYEPRTQTFTTNLRDGDGPPVPLAAVRGETLGKGLDLLAWHTRAAIGEDVRHVEPAPIACELAYSANPNCIRFTELGRKDLASGQLGAALRLFQTARRHDPASPEAAILLAATTANRADTSSQAEAARIAKDSLALPTRLTLAAQHRLAKILLQSVLYRSSGAAAKMLELGETYREDRPNDPHGRFTIAHALCMLGRYTEARPHLEALRKRWPSSAPVRYQLAFAMLATDSAESALTVLEESRRGLPRAVLVRPMAMALFHAGKHDELRRFLKRLRSQPGVAGATAEREILRMQASHAILTGQTKEAAKLLAESMAWLRKHNADLSDFALDVVEDGEVLARLGQRQLLADAVNGFLQLGQLPHAFAQSVTYLGGLLSLLQDDTPGRALATLQKSHDSVLYRQLEAAVHRHDGELRAETAALKRVVSRSDDALAYANYARALAAAGDHQTAIRMSQYVRKRLLAFDQRNPHDHPLMTPGRAMAFAATR